MRQLIEQIIESHLEPYLARLEELSSETEELRRRMQNMIRLGFVNEVHESGTLIRVKHGQLTSPFIKWFSESAGDTKDYRCPSVGEQALLLNYASGNNGSQTVALVGLFSTNFPSPSSDPNEIIRCYPDGSLVSYHTKDHVMKIEVQGDVEVTASKNAKVTAGEKVTVDAASIHLNGGKGVVTGDHLCMITGKPHGDCSSQVTAAK